LWRITCMENDWPGLWQLWLRHQCVTVGYPPGNAYKIEGRNLKGKSDWNKAKRALKEIKPGHFIVATLPDRRIGRLGEVIRNETGGDRWQVLIPKSPDDKYGQMGRRVLVRWEIENTDRS